MENQGQNNLNPAGEPANSKPLAAERGVTGAGKLGDYFLGIIIAVIGSDILGYITAIYFSVDNLGYFDIVDVNREFGYGLWLGFIHWPGLLWVSALAFFGLFLKTRWKYVIRGMFLPTLIGLIFFILLFGWCLLVLRSYGG